MSVKQNIPMRLLSMLLVLAVLLSMIPLSAIPAKAYTQSQLPGNMWDNSILRALEYTGFNVPWLKDNGLLYDYNFISGRVPGNTPAGIQILSGIPYSYGAGSGMETVGDMPDINTFKSTGLDCVDFACGYYLTNYLPNVEGVDTSMLTEMQAKYAATYDRCFDHMDFWPAACADLEADGRAIGYHFEVSDSVNNTPEYVAVFDKLVPGDLIIMGDNSDATKHYAIYAGYFDGDGDGQKDAYIIHSGNSRGPEISMVKYMADPAVGDKQSWPLDFYHFNWGSEPIKPFEEKGFIEVYKKDPGDRPLAGAWFAAVNSETGTKVAIGPTNSDGYAISDEIDFGEWVITETTFPDGYTSAGETSWTRTLDENSPNKTVTINAVNKLKEGQIGVRKQNEFSGSLGNAVFGVYSDPSCGTLVTTITTSSDGSGVSVPLTADTTYYLKEITTPSSAYIADSTVYPVTVVSDTVTWANNGNGIVNFMKRGNLRITKDSENNAVSGIRFRLHGTSDTGVAVDEYATTNAQGIATFSNILTGTYTVEESNVANHYISPAAQTVTIQWNTTADARFSNELKKGNLRITKTSEDNKVSGIRFWLHGTSDSGVVVNEYATTDASGVAVFNNIPIGSAYTIEEVDAAAYYIAPAAQNITVRWNDTTNASFHNALKRGDLQVTKTAEDGIVAGKKFRLHGISDSGIAVDLTATTDANGIARFEDVLIGSAYTIEEIDTPAYYIPPSSQLTAIPWNSTANVSFHNALKRGDVKVTKTAEDNLIAGLRFHLTGISDSGIPVDAYATTDDTGVAVFEDILIGSNYTLEEVDTPSRYVIPEPQTSHVNWNEVTTHGFHNTLKKWQLTATKVDTQMTTAQGDATLAGAVYGVYRGDDLIDTYTTDANGQFTTAYYICGDNWSLREITPSEGYNLNTDIVHINAESTLYTVELNSTTLQVTEDIIGGKLTITKHTDNGSTQIETPEAGAEFEVFLKAAGSYANAKESERHLLVCDEYGYAETKRLPYGVYTVKQTKSWDGVITLEEFDVFISQEGSVQRFLINNAPFFSYLKVVKTDSETGKNIPYAGAAFQIYDPNGNKVEMTLTYPQVTVIDTFYTNAEGTLITPQELPYGFGYTLVEVAAPTGYVLDQTPIPFDITIIGSTEENGLTIVTVNRPNTPQKGTITVTKNGEVFSSVTVSDGIYQPVYEIKGLAGAVYQVTAAEDIITPDGTLRYSKDQIVATLTTGTDGTATSAPLYLGKYHVQEITAPYGMVLNDTVNEVELTYAGQLVSVTSASTSFTNERQKITVDLIKSLEQDTHYGIGMNGEIQSVKFALYAAKVLTAEDGSEIPADGLLEIASCDSNGKITFTTDIPLDAELYVKEYSTGSHYILSDVRYPVAFLYAGQSVPSVSVTVNDGNTISNEIIRGSILGKKLDEDGFSICGCVFGLFRADETEFTEANALLTCPSNELGVFLFEDVPFGNWIVREISSTPAFILNTQNYPVSIERDGQTVQLEIVNKFITGGVKVTKVDAEYPENKLTGATFEVYVDVDGDKVFDPAIDILIGELTETETGIYTMDGLRYNGYFIHEKVAPEGFLLDDGYYFFEIRTHEQIVTVETEAGKNFINNPIKGNAETTKVDAEYPENKLSGAVFEIYEDTNGNGKFDADTDKLLGQMKESEIGIYTMNDLRYGGYFLHEKVAPEGFLLDNGYHYFEIRNHGETVIVENEAGKSFINDPIKGSVETDKVDADYPDNTLSGAIFEIYEDSNGNGKFDAGTDKLIGEMTEGKNGKHSMNDLRYGGYFLHEKVAPKGFLLDDGYYFFEIREHGKTVTVETEAGKNFINNPIKGSVQTDKVDADYPDNTLSGAIFEIYEDTNADGKFDPATDKLVGEMTEGENGRYTMNDLRYGSYFLHEKVAPKGFLLDDGYYFFEIREHGKTVTVSNNAGTCFINKAMTGSFELVKKDKADGTPLKDVGFRILDENGNVIHEGRTDENGRFGTTLRLGKYFYQETDPLDGYVADDTQYAFEIREHGQIVSVEMTNEKISVIPDTGDHNILSVAGSTMLVSALALMILLGFRKKETCAEI